MAANSEAADNSMGFRSGVPNAPAGMPTGLHFPLPRGTTRRWRRRAGRGTVDPLLSPALDLEARRRVRLFYKHSLDRILAVLALITVIPLLVLIGVAVRISSPGPALFRHERVGRHGKPFRVWKFRTMRQGADAELQQLLEAHGRNGVPLFKVPHDPRVTPLGRFLRRTSLDELPQLLNVLCGQMSLVGPRPQIRAEVDLYRPNEWLRLEVKPGVTGLWQVSGRSALTWDEAVQYDLRYVREWSLMLDLKILLRTVSVVLRRDGAM